MLNKVLVAKFLTAMTLAGFATGAAAGLNGDDPADGETIELEIPFSDDDESASSDDTTEDESEDADDSETDDADDEAAEEEAEADEDADAVVEEPKDPTHGSIVSACARNTEATGRDHGEAVSTVAKDDTAECADLPEQSGDPEEAPAKEPEAAADEDEADEDKPRASKAQGADHRNEKATEKLAERDARKAGR